MWSHTALTNPGLADFVSKPIGLVDSRQQVTESGASAVRYAIRREISINVSEEDLLMLETTDVDNKEIKNESLK